MREMTKAELRECQIGILDFFVNICNTYHLKYWLDYGTLLGAVRHKGYIPWDDDIDVAMFREDYDKLINICQLNLHDRYKLSCVETDPSCMYPFGKMIDSYTELWELGDEGIKTGVYIDIFVYDNSPINENERNKIFDRLDFYGKLRKYQLPIKKSPITIKRLIVLLVRTAIKLLPRQFFTKAIVKEAQKIKNIKSQFVSDFTCPYYNSRWFVEKAIFEEQIDLEFEGNVYKAPKRYHEWLTLQYHDYMKIPSVEEQQKAQHIIKAFYKGQ